MSVVPATYAVETQGLVKEFAGFRAVNGVDLRLEVGKVHALVGPNGAGKTSLFNLLTGFLQPLGEDLRGRVEATRRAGDAQDRVVAPAPPPVRPLSKPAHHPVPQLVL